MLETYSDFSMPDKRLNLIVDSDELVVYRDFAHAPSKVSASVRAIRKMFPSRKLVSVLEIHTYSSLNKEFLPQYQNCFNGSDSAFVYYNPEALAIKRMAPMSADDITKSFGHKDLVVSTDPSKLFNDVASEIGDDCVVLLMSSSNFGGLDWLRLQD